VVAWICWFSGHAGRGQQPSFVHDLKYLLIGPVWLVAQGFRRAGWRY